jgi:hypothetical protein
MANLNDNVLDNGLASLKAGASHIYICSQEPATFTQASSTYALGVKNFGAGAVFPSAIAAGTPSGRKLDTAAVADGVITTTGTATHYAIVSTAASRLDVSNSLTSSQVVTAGNPWTMASLPVRLANLGG